MTVTIYCVTGYGSVLPEGETLAAVGGLFNENLWANKEGPRNERKTRAFYIYFIKNAALTSPKVSSVSPTPLMDLLMFIPPSLFQQEAVFVCVCVVVLVCPRALCASDGQREGLCEVKDKRSV